MRKQRVASVIDAVERSEARRPAKLENRKVDIANYERGKVEAFHKAWRTAGNYVW